MKSEIESKIKQEESLRDTLKKSEETINFYKKIILGLADQIATGQEQRTMENIKEIRQMTNKKKPTQDKIIKAFDPCVNASSNNDCILIVLFTIKKQNLKVRFFVLYLENISQKRFQKLLSLFRKRSLLLRKNRNQHIQ